MEQRGVEPVQGGQPLDGRPFQLGLIVIDLLIVLLVEGEGS
jgi:hypothetical protein